MNVRCLIAAPDPESLGLYRSLVQSALDLLPLDVDVAYSSSREAASIGVAAHRYDVVMLDWELAGPETPDFLRSLIGLQPGLRSVVVMPLHLRQYRRCLWEAGVCVALPKDNLDQEWLLSVLCLITRAMAREARAREAARQELQCK